MESNGPWLHVVVLVPHQLSRGGEAEPHEQRSQAQLPLRDCRFKQVCSNVEPAAMGGKKGLKQRQTSLKPAFLYPTCA